MNPKPIVWEIQYQIPYEEFAKNSQPDSYLLYRHRCKALEHDSHVLRVDTTETHEQSAAVLRINLTVTFEQGFRRPQNPELWYLHTLHGKPPPTWYERLEQDSFDV